MKKRNRKNWLGVILAAGLTASVLAACGRSDRSLYSGNEGVYESAAGASYDSGGISYAVAEATDYQYDTAVSAEEAPVSEGGAVEVSEAAQGRKLIKNVDITAETEEFDALVSALQGQVESLGGYVESISVYDVDSYYVEDTLRKRRNADITARVPQEKLDGFLSQVGEQTNVTSRSERVEDVTLQYVDLESHKKSLLTEQERLLALMEQAQSVEDIIAIEGRLSEVRYQLESMESQLRTYDNQIDYSTVYLSIQEVRAYSPAQNATVGQRIKNGFMRSLENIGFAIRDFAIYFVIDLPYILLGLLAAAAVFFVWRRFRKRREGGHVWRSRRAGVKKAEESRPESDTKEEQE